MKEQFANAAQSTLAADLDDSSTSVSVVAPTLFPTIGQWRLLVDAEIMLVTAIASGVFTVERGAEGTTAAQHLAGSTATAIVTKGAMENALLGVKNGIVFKPGATASQGIVTEWADVQAFITLNDGACVVYVDDSIVSPAVVPGASGVTECQGKTEFRDHISDSVAYTVLQIEEGATLRNVARIDAIEIRSNSTGTPSLSFSGTPNGGFLVLKDFALLSMAATATAPMFDVASGILGIVMYNAAFALNAAGPLFHVRAGAQAYVLAFDGSVIPNDYATVDATGSFALNYDDSTSWTFPTRFVPPTILGTGTYFASPQSRFDGVAKPTVTGAKGGNAALASLLSALSALGLITDNTSP